MGIRHGALPTLTSPVGTRQSTTSQSTPLLLTHSHSSMRSSRTKPQRSQSSPRRRPHQRLPLSQRLRLLRRRKRRKSRRRQRPSTPLSLSPSQPSLLMSGSVNTPTATPLLPLSGFENFNAEDYSIWRVDYKYNEELTQVFMTSNLIGGFFARLEGSRKYIFGCASVYGVKDDSVIQGAFVIRGQEALPAFDVAPDYESYEFTKLDPTKAEDKEFVNDQWTWEKPVPVNGKEYPWADGKVFK